MTDNDYDEAQSELIKAISDNAPCTLEEAIPVTVSLDNGVVYKGHAVEVQPKSDSFPDGLVMVRTASADLGVPVSYIRGR